MKLIIGDDSMTLFGEVVDGNVTITKVPLKDEGIEFRDGAMIEHYLKTKVQGLDKEKHIEYSEVAKHYEGLNNIEIMNLSKKQ